MSNHARFDESHKPFGAEPAPLVPPQSEGAFFCARPGSGPEVRGPRSGEANYCPIVDVTSDSVLSIQHSALSTLFLQAMRTSLKGLLVLSLLVNSLLLAQPGSSVIRRFEPRGIGGGGALYNPSINPLNKDEVFMTSDMSELYHSTDFGRHWDMVDFRQMIGWNTTGRVAYTSDPKIMYSISNSDESPKAVKSMDGGITWQAIENDPVVGSDVALFADHASTTRYFIVGMSAAYLTTDGGTSFTKVLTDPTGNTWGAGALFAGQTIFLATNHGLLHSNNGGVTFEAAGTGIPAGEFICSMSGSSQGGVTRLYAVTNTNVNPFFTGANYDAYGGVYQYDEVMERWASMKSKIMTQPVFVACAQNNLNVVYVAGGGAGAPTVWKTSNNGSTWSSVFKTSGNENIATGWAGAGGDRDWSFGEYALGFAVCPSDANRLIITDLGHPHLSSDGGATWEQGYVEKADENPAGASTPKGKSYRSNGLDQTTAWTVFWIDSLNLMAGFADIKGIRSSDAGHSWHMPFNNFAINATYSFEKANDGTVYAATSTVHDMYESQYLTDARIDGGKGQVLFSKDKGATWQLLHDFTHPVVWLAYDKANPNRMYASVVHSTQGGIFVTNNLAAGASSTWTKLTNPPRTEGHPFNIRILGDGGLVVSYSGRRNSSGKFTQSSGVFFSSDAGQSWQDRSDDGLKWWTKDVVIEPGNENTWYAGSFSGWGGGANDLGALYRTTNRGGSWTKLTSREDVESVTFDATGTDKMYYASGVHGLYYTSNSHAAQPTFTSVASYPFSHPVRGVTNPYKPDEMWVVGFGGGMRVAGENASLPIPLAPVLISPPDSSYVDGPYAAGDGHDIIFEWHSVPGRNITYKVQLSYTEDFAHLGPWREDIIDTSGSFFVLSGFRTFWRVCAKNENGFGPWSQIWSLKMQPLGVQSDLESKALVKIYPVPSKNLVTLEVNSLSLTKPDLAVVNTAGVILSRHQMPNQGGTFVIRDLPPGVYYAVLRSRKSQVVRKFEIVK
jgi:hypothetical protein